MIDPVSVTAMVAGIISAIMACGKMFRKLWLKIKGMFSSESALRMVPRDTLSHALEGVLRRDAGLRAETFQYYKPRIESAARQMGELRAAAAGPDDGFIQFSF